jgi:hypothetical protein
VSLHIKSGEICNGLTSIDILLVDIVLVRIVKIALPDLRIANLARIPLPDLVRIDTVDLSHPLIFVNTQICFSSVFDHEMSISAYE